MVRPFCCREARAYPRIHSGVSSCLRWIGGFMPAYHESEGSNALDARFGKARHAGFRRCLAQVEPPGERQAGCVEAEIDDERELRTAGDGDRLAEAARDQIAAAGTDGADEAECSPALDARRLQRRRAAGLALAPRLPQVLLAE